MNTLSTTYCIGYLIFSLNVHLHSLPWGRMSQGLYVFIPSEAHDSKAPVAQWFRHLPNDQKIPGSNRIQQYFLRFVLSRVKGPQALVFNNVSID